MTSTYKRKRRLTLSSNIIHITQSRVIFFSLYCFMLSPTFGFVKEAWSRSRDQQVLSLVADAIASG